MTDQPRNNAPKTRGRPFPKGNRGRPAGSRNKASLVIERLFEGEAEAIGEAVLKLGRAGNARALQMIVDRIAPVRRDRPIEFPLPPITTAGDAVQASTALLQAVAAGAVTPVEGERVMALLNAHTAILEAHDFERRLQALEEKQP